MSLSVCTLYFLHSDLLLIIVVSRNSFIYSTIIYEDSYQTMNHITHVVRVGAWEGVASHKAPQTGCRKLLRVAVRSFWNLYEVGLFKGVRRYRRDRHHGVGGPRS